VSRDGWKNALSAGTVWGVTDTTPPQLYDLNRAHELKVGAERQAARFLDRALKAEAEAIAWRTQFGALCKALTESRRVPADVKNILHKLAEVAK
jgi:hypothetical protein